MVKAQEIVNYTTGLIGQSIDEDGLYGAQCMDLTVHIMKRFFGWYPYGNAIDLSIQNMPTGFTRILVTNANQIKAGDVLIWGLGEFAAFGHTAIAIEDGKSDGTFVSIDQNWINPSLEFGSPAARIVHNLHGVWGVIRPNYEEEAQEPEKPKEEEEVTMVCTYIIDKKGAIYYFDGQVVKALTSSDQAVALREIYRRNNGKEMPHIEYSSKAPFYDHLVEVTKLKAL